MVADALVIAPHTAGVVLVARHNQTTYDEYAEALEKVEASNANLLGAVICDLKMSEGSYGRYGKYKNYGRYGRSGYNRYYRRYDYEYGNDGK